MYFSQVFFRLQKISFMPYNPIKCYPTSKKKLIGARIQQYLIYRTRHHPHQPHQFFLQESTFRSKDTSEYAHQNRIFFKQIYGWFKASFTRIIGVKNVRFQKCSWGKKLNYLSGRRAQPEKDNNPYRLRAIKMAHNELERKCLNICADSSYF